MCRARPEVNRSEVLRGRDQAWFCNYCKILSVLQFKRSALWIAVGEFSRTVEQTCNGAVMERTSNQWKSGVMLSQYLCYPVHVPLSLAGFPSKYITNFYRISKNLAKENKHLCVFSIHYCYANIRSKLIEINSRWRNIFQSGVIYRSRRRQSNVMM